MSESINGQHGIYEHDLAAAPLATGKAVLQQPQWQQPTLGKAQVSRLHCM